MSGARDTLPDLSGGVAEADAMVAHLIEIRTVAAGMVEDLDDLIALARRQADEAEDRGTTE